MLKDDRREDLRDAEEEKRRKDHDDHGPRRAERERETDEIGETVQEAP